MSPVEMGAVTNGTKGSDIKVVKPSCWTVH
jgi:hypothetical protein